MNWPKVLLLALLLPILGGFGYIFYHKVGELVAMKRREQRLQSSVQVRETRLSTLVREYEELENNPAELERLARDKLGLAKEGETIFIFEPTPVPAGSPERRE